MFFRCFGGIFQALSMPPRRREHEAGSQIKKMYNELVRALRFDNIGAPSNCSREHVPVG